MTAATFTATFAANGTYTWVAPTGVSTVKVECWGGGGSGQAGGTPGGGGGGGEYAAEASLAVTAGNSYTVTVGQGSNSTANGGNSTFPGDSVTVTAHGGVACNGATGTAGGSGSTNTTHHNGGSGGNGGSAGQGGGGGGGSGGSGAAGNNGATSSSSTGGAGGSAVTSGGAGGNGGNTGANAANGGAPGGAGGGSPDNSHNAGNGADGQVVITWTMTSVATISNSTSGGTYAWVCPAANTTVSWVITGTATFDGHSVNSNETVTAGTSYTITVGNSGTLAITWPAANTAAMTMGTTGLTFAATGTETVPGSGGVTMGRAGLLFAGNGTVGSVINGVGNMTMGRAGMTFGASGNAAGIFPTGVLGVKVEFLLNGTWTDVTTYCYQRDGSVNIEITSFGRPDETQDKIQAAQMTLQVNNRNGTFSPKNTSSIFYPFIGRNVQVRVSVTAFSTSLVYYSGYRFWGECSVWPVEWDLTGTDVWVNITVGDVLRRYLQGELIGSALKRFYLLKTDSTAPVTLWACDEGTGGTFFANQVNPANTMTWSGSPQLASDTAFLGCDPAPQINKSTWTGSTGSYSGSGTALYTTPGTYSWVAPGGVNQATAECWGAGGGGGINDGGGGGGGEYAKETNAAVTAGTAYALTVGTAGNTASAGGNSTWAGDAVTVTAHGGLGGASNSGSGGGPGTGSTNVTHHDGGSGAASGSGTATTTWSTPGTYSWTAPADVPATVDVKVWGAGAGGGGGGASQGGEGGGGGEYAEETAFAVTAGQTYTVVVGAGGVGATTGNSGGAGGQSSFAGGAGVVANGGSAGSNFSGGAGGTGSTNSVHHHGGAGGGVGVGGFTGGDGGGGSGGSSGNGGDAMTSSSSTGAAGGAAGSGGGASGGSGGNSAANGNNGNAPGGGGGGAGAGSGASNLTKTYTPTVTYCYYGTDASQSPGGLVNTNSSMYQGEYNGGGANGHEFSYMLFPWSTIQSDFSGYTIDSVKVVLVNQHSWYNSGMYASLYGVTNTSFSGTHNWATDSGTTSFGDYWVNSHGTLTADITAAGGSAFTNGGAKTLRLGGGSNSTDLYHYGYFEGGSSPQLIVTGHTSAIEQAGKGAAGQVQVSYPAGGGGGGGSGGTAATGNSSTSGTGGAAVTGGGPGGNAGATGPGNPPSSGPGGGGGGAGVSGAAGNGYAGQVKITYSSSTTPAKLALRFCLSVPSSGATDTATLVRAVVSSGSLTKIECYYGAGGKLGYRGYNGVTLKFDSGLCAFSTDGTPMMVSLELSTSGANLAWAIRAITPGSGSVLNPSGNTGTFTTATIGAISSVVVSPNADVTDTAISMIVLQYDIEALTVVSNALNGFNGERAGTRFLRFCTEEGFTGTLIGNASDTPVMGPQTDMKFTDLLQQIEDVDRGQMFPTRSALGMTYRTRVNLQNQTPSVVIDYAAGMLAAFKPNYDDLLTRNSVRVTRDGGSTAVAVQSSGALSTQTPPNGVGVYPYTPTIAVQLDSQLANLALWILTVGTVDEYRYPTFELNMARTEVAALGVFDGIPSMTIGDFLQIVNLPGFLPSPTANQLLWGVASEKFGSFGKWYFALNLVPESPYTGGSLPTW
jgi:hypothetical protein